MFLLFISIFQSRRLFVCSDRLFTLEKKCFDIITALEDFSRKLAEISNSALVSIFDGNFCKFLTQDLCYKLKDFWYVLGLSFSWVSDETNYMKFVIRARSAM